MPNVIGCIDGTQIPIIAPSGDREPDFVNRKGVHSINVQVFLMISLTISVFRYMFYLFIALEFS
jgi:hypothetical protein